MTKAKPRAPRGNGAKMMSGTKRNYNKSNKNGKGQDDQ
jgi:hypothetical protein